MRASGKNRQDIVNRFESKYLIPRELIPELRRFIAPFTAPDPHGRGSPPEYTITTLQLDTPQLAFHHAKEWEAVDRFKLRVRTYGEPGSSPVFTEIKAKYRDTIVKTRAQIPFSAWRRELVFAPGLPRIFKSEKQEIDFLKFKLLTQQTGAEPALLVRYIRESYVGTLDHYLRVTFDRALEYQATRSWTDFGRSGLWRCMDSAEAQAQERSQTVLEIKTLYETPLWVVDLVERFQLKKGGNCKYSTGIWREGLFRGIPQGRDNALEALDWS